MGKVMFNFIMFGVNVVFFLAGAAVLSFGIIILVDPALIENLLNSLTGYENINYLIDLNAALLDSGVLFTVVGSVIVAVSLVGLATCCCGGSCLCTIYALFLGLIIAFEVAVIIFTSLNYSNLQGKIQSYMYSALQENFNPVSVDLPGGGSINIPSEGSAWSLMQFNYGCCGAYDASDYQRMDWQQETDYPESLVPPSCCMQINQYNIPDNINQLVNYTQCMHRDNKNLSFVNTKGCYLVTMGVISKYGYITNIVIVSLIALEILILQLAVHECYRLKAKDKKPTEML